MSSQQLQVNDKLIQLEETIAEMKRNFDCVFDHAIDGVLILDDDTIVDCNDATVQMLNAQSKDDVLLTHPSELSPPTQADGRDSFEKANEMIALAKANGFHRFEWRHQKKTGEFLPVEVSITTITLDGKEYLHAYWKDLTEHKAQEKKILTLVNKLEEQNRQLFKLATTDDLTGVANRRSLGEYFETHIKLAKRKKRVLSLFLLDIDFFKGYNDQYGHVSGDAALQTIASSVVSAVRDTDLVARYGGEEFAALLPETNKQGAIKLAEKIRSTIENISTLMQQVTVSVGVTTLNLAQIDAQDTESLYQTTIREADQALYYAKENGRNRVDHFCRIKDR